MIKLIYLLFISLFIACKQSKINSDNQLTIYGCTNSEADNYHFDANIDDGSCIFSGCMDPESANYDSNANIEDGNCIETDKIPAGYTYYWNDEFNRDSLNDRYWNIEIRWPGFVNNESQSYTDSDANIFLENGNLYIRALKDNPFDPNQPAYTSGRINTKEKVELQYGFWEIRAKLPRGVGTWPAIWMLNSYIDSLGWPNCGEIDIMEHVGYDPNHVFFSLHNANLYGDIHGTNQQGIYELEGIENDFHTYSVEWDSSFVRAYFDGNLFFNYPKPEIHDINSWPYDNPFFLIINLAIGGEWGGQQGIDNSIFPATFTIDYVRIFKKTDL
tara:strand:+ start:967 stop:1953 length:987 start_codon:yes stop_codon:yes gene_type:complete